QQRVGFGAAIAARHFNAARVDLPAQLVGAIARKAGEPQHFTMCALPKMAVFAQNSAPKGLSAVRELGRWLWRRSSAIDHEGNQAESRWIRHWRRAKGLFLGPFRHRVLYFYPKTDTSANAKPPPRSKFSGLYFLDAPPAPS